MEFIGFPKSPRLTRPMVITEKIDGTNAQIVIVNKALFDNTALCGPTPVGDNGEQLMLAGSRTRWINPKEDNFGFAKWVEENSKELFKLGEGQHFGEWWGSGIQRGYDLPKGEKRFSLFNTSRWSDASVRPECCHVVPILHKGMFDTTAIQATLQALELVGSQAAPGFMKPEGIMVFHAASGIVFKKTIHKDEAPKSQVTE
jgi:hypothetical protein